MEQEQKLITPNTGINFGYYLFDKPKKNNEENDNVREKYQMALESKESVILKFDFANTEGDLIKYEGEYKIVLKNEDILGESYNLKRRMSMLVKRYAVKVKTIDEDTKTINVSYADIRNVDREKLLEVLNAEHEGLLKVPARVVAVYSNLLILDIGGLGIPGFMRVADWSASYTVDFNMVVHRNDVIDVAVLKEGRLSPKEYKKHFARWNDQNQEPFCCSRKLTLEENPWLNIEQRLKKGDFVTIRVIGKRPENFFGVNSSFPELTFYGHYRDPGEKLDHKGVIIGKSYECVVRVVDEEKRYLRVRVLREIEGEYLDD